MAATNRSELLEITRKEFVKLEKLIVSIDRKAGLLKDEDSTSIKDVVAHRAHWISLFFGWYADGLAGTTVYFPAKGYKWNDLKSYNAELRKQQSGLGWDDALKMLQNDYEKLIEFIESKSDKELYTAPMKGANNHWTPGRWAEAAGASHFRSAAKYIRARLRAAN